jgi:hypothetical protein
MKMAWLAILHRKEEKYDSSPFLGQRLRYFLLENCPVTIPRGLKRWDRMTGLEDFVKSCAHASGGEGVSTGGPAGRHVRADFWCFSTPV